MYPVPFRRLDEVEQYKKYDCRLVRNKTDRRPETFRPVDESELRVLDWEVGALFWNCLRLAGGRESDEPNALAKVNHWRFAHPA